MTDARTPTLAEIANSFRVQAAGCRQLGSPLYAAILEPAAREIEAGGFVSELFAGWRGHPALDALALRLLGGVHRLVMEGHAPDLARHYPSVGGTPDLARAWPDFRATLEAHPERVRAVLDEPVQTNEIGRSAVLLGGFLRVAAWTGLPIRLLEFGSAAGLNLLFDRHRYELGEHRFGDPQAEIVVRTDWQGPAPDLDARLRVVARAGSDPRPLDLRDPATVQRLASFVWPEQGERFDRLHAAVRLAQREGAPVERLSAAAFLRRELASTHEGVATVVFHSVVWMYLSEAERAEVTGLVQAAGAAAGPRAPVFWLRMEGVAREAELRLMRFAPDRHGAVVADDVLLAHAHYHGNHVRWVAPPHSP